jgi:hypothetical protein
MVLLRAASAVRIRNAVTGKVVGMGFLGPGNRIGTCAHVAARAAGVDEFRSDLPVGAVVTVDFPITSSTWQAQAEVVAWKARRPDDEPDGTLADATVLELRLGPGEGLPDGVRPVVIASSRLAGLGSQPAFTAIGVPRQRDAGTHARGDILGPVGGRLLELRSHDPLDRDFVEEGFSGTAVWTVTRDSEAEVMVGMMVKVYGSTNAYAIPAEALFEIWPELASSTAEDDISRPAQAASEPDVLEIRSVGRGQVIWNGLPSCVLGDEFASLWTLPSPVRRVRLGFAATDEPGLTRAVHRLICHTTSGDLTVEALAGGGWREELKTSLRQRMPTHCSSGPHLTENLSAAGLGQGAGLSDTTPMSSGQLADQIENSLDHWCLQALGVRVQNCLSGQSVALDIDVEPVLAGDLLKLWDSWYDGLRSDSRILHRFLEMLVSADDGTSHEWSRLGLGPLTVSACMVPATIMMLTVAECGDQAIHPNGGGPLRPHGNIPGNLAGKDLRAHGTGILRKDRQQLDQWLASQTKMPWRSRIVMLSGLTDPQPFLRHRLRPLGAARTDSRFATTTLSMPAIVTLDDTFKDKLRQGREAVEVYLRRVFRFLHDQQAQLLQLTIPSC